MPGFRCTGIAVVSITLGACSPPRADGPGLSATLVASTAAVPPGGAPTDRAAAVLAELDIAELHALEQARASAGEFWRADAGARSERLERLITAEHAAREALVARLGAAIEQAPAFGMLFRPLANRLPELSSSQQIAIHDLERAYVDARLAAPADIDFAAHLASIRDRLGESVAREYALRSSPLAAQLRGSGVIAAAEEFRDVFEILDGGAQDRGGFVETRRLLRARLGSTRFVRLWSLRDPRFAQLRAGAARFGLTPDTLQAAYALLLDNEEAMLAAAIGQDAGSDAAQASLRSLYDDARRRLNELIGADAADALLLAFSAASAGVVAAGD